MISHVRDDVQALTHSFTYSRTNLPPCFWERTGELWGNPCEQGILWGGSWYLLHHCATQWESSCYKNGSLFDFTGSDISSQSSHQAHCLSFSGCEREFTLTHKWTLGKFFFFSLPCSPLFIAAWWPLKPLSTLDTHMPLLARLLGSPWKRLLILLSVVN